MRCQFCGFIVKEQEIMPVLCPRCYSTLTDADKLSDRSEDSDENTKPYEITEE